MTKQEMFDKAARGILDQGGPSATDNGTCKYRCANGRKCAAGHIIPDALFTPEMEGTTCAPLTTDEKAPTQRYYETTSAFAERLRFIYHHTLVVGALEQLGADIDFARALQLAHDNVLSDRFGGVSDDTFMSSWKENMRVLASQHGLDASVLEPVTEAM